jgi:WD40 repeat protein
MTRSTQAPDEPRSEAGSRELSPTGPRSLALRSAALVRRGLRDLARDSNWLVRKVFDGPVSNAAVSSDGQVSAISPRIHQGAQSLTLFDIERCLSTLTLGLAAPQSGTDSAARFAWSPDGRYLLAGWKSQNAQIELFDLHAKTRSGSFGKFPRVPSDLAWSPSGDWVATSCGGKSPSLDLWRMQPQTEVYGGAIAAPVQEIRVPDWLEDHSGAVDPESGEAGAFSGYGRIAFSPDEKSLAAVVQIGGEWADDMIVFLSTPDLRRKITFEVQGRVTDLTWSNDGTRLVYCSAGQSYGIDPVSAESTALPFGGEQCAWHPHLPICLFFSSWLRSSAKGRLFLVDMNRISVFDEYAAEGVLDLSWSEDGAKAYAITNDGLGYIYEPELL